MAENTQEEGQTLDGEPSQPGRPCVLSLSGACRKARTSQLGAGMPPERAVCKGPALLTDQTPQLFPSLEENPGDRQTAATVFPGVLAFPRPWYSLSGLSEETFSPLLIVIFSVGDPFSALLR